MDRVIAPLCEMGASVVAEGPDGTSPSPGHFGELGPRPSVASAQVKGALLLAGLFARGKTTVGRHLRAGEDAQLFPGRYNYRS